MTVHSERYTGNVMPDGPRRQVLIILLVSLVVAVLPLTASVCLAQASYGSDSYEPVSGDPHGLWEAGQEGSIYIFHVRFPSRLRGDVRFTCLAEDMTGLIYGPEVRFRLVRDAGAFHFVGRFEEIDTEDMYGEGDCYFEPNPDYLDQLDSIGYSTSRSYLDVLSTPPELRLAARNLSLDYAGGILRRGLEIVSLSRLTELHDHGVTLEYIDNMAALGYEGMSADRLQELRDHGVGPDYIEELARQGHDNLSESELLMARDHGVTPGFISELAELGYDGMSLSQLVEMRDHGADPDYIRDLSELGYQDLDADLVVKMRDHGVSAAFIRSLAGEGYRDLEPELLIELRDHGVSSGFIKRLRREGITDLTPEELIEYKDQGEPVRSGRSQ